MAVTKATYTATATWTASQLADTFKSAFIAAGLMSDWHDTFLNTVENRVLKVIYDAGKTYGTVYYWFMFTTSGVFIHTALDWNVSTHVPQGTQYLDYYATTTNATTNHRQIITLSSATSVTVTRYTSAVNTGATWFLIRNGTTNQAFIIPTATWGPSSLVDQNKIAFNGVIFPFLTSTSFNTSIAFYQGAGHTRRTFLASSALRGSTSSSSYIFTPYVFKYSGFGNANNSSANYNTLDSATAVWLPTAAVNTQSSLASDHTPVFTSPTVSPYQAALPSDFGIASYYSSNAMAVQDTFVVSSGVEEWEMITVSTNTNTDASRLLLLARTV
jgi:hypothetical protein